jgi:hypothetical protein
MVVDGQYAYVLSGHGLFILELYMPDSIRTISSLDLGWNVYTVELIHNSTGLLVGLWSSTCFVDISDKRNPFIASSFRGGYAMQFNEYTYAGAPDSGFLIYNFKNDVPLINHITTVNGKDLEVTTILVQDDSVAFVGDRWGTIFLFDIKDPTNVNLITTIETDVENVGGAIVTMKYQDNHLYVGHHVHGLRIYDINDFQNITLVGYYSLFPGGSTYPLYDLEVEDEYIYCSWQIPLQISTDTGFVYVLENTLITAQSEEIHEVVNNFSLLQNYPNPFNPTTTIKYGLPEQSNVKIEIFNMLGQNVDILVDGNKAAGSYQTTWNAKDLPSGIYLITINAEGVNSKNNFRQVKKTLLLK